MKRSLRIKVEKSKDGQFFARIVAGNGQTLFTSETYKRRASALKACGLLALIDKRTEIDSESGVLSVGVASGL